MDTKSGLSKAMQFVFGLLLAFNFVQTCAALTKTKQNYEPDPTELRGKEVIDGKYPNGWVYADKLNAGRLYKPNEGVFEHLKKGQWYAKIYERVIEVNDLKGAEGKKKRTFIVDALIIRRRSYPWIFEEASTCKFADGGKLINGFIASVNFERCRRYSTHIEKAWGWDDKLQKFITQPTKGLTCELVVFGQDPETESCINWGKCFAKFGVTLTNGKTLSNEQWLYCRDNFSKYPSGAGNAR